MRREVIQNGPLLAQAQAYGGLVYVSGQVGIDKITGQLVPGGIEEQVRCGLLPACDVQVKMRRGVLTTEARIECASS